MVALSVQGMYDPLMQLGSGTRGTPPHVGGGPPAGAAAAPGPPAVGPLLNPAMEAQSSGERALGARVAPDPKRPRNPLQAQRTTPPPPPPRTNATWKPMRRGLRPAAGPTSICGIGLVPTAVVDRGPAAAADRQVPATGTCAPVPAAACLEKGAQHGPMLDAACSALMRAMSTGNVNPNNFQTNSSTRSG